ncbi:MAG TPA: 16S rRNA (adenine(1518)-N(6)/adenine(1519)-N(6))-dimethyltransferase RsmA [Bryobacteraceae bacterium]|nr:16S rRNA (adenine(1518)-N(6)/adenine(1519)-N(6))-dimethyltransferase RsmA [Bryobacteraceae bacterium]
MPGRRLGQHFLVRKSILERIAAAACPGPPAPACTTVVEIGPGRGALTEHLLQRAERLIAIEVDTVLVHYLQQKFRGNPRLTIVNADVLQTDLAQWGPVTVAGNLPYYITSPILDRVLTLGTLLQRATFLVQKEVAERIAAPPGRREYGYLSVQTQIFSEPKILFEVPPGAFHPPPKVDSAVIALAPRLVPLTGDPSALLAFAGACFRHKRKTLRNNLLELYPKEVLDTLPEGKLRAEQLSIPQFLELHRRLGSPPIIEPV